MYQTINYYYRTMLQYTYSVIWMWLFFNSYFYSPDTATSPQETTEATHVEIVTRNYITTTSTIHVENVTMNYSTTASPNEKGNLKYKNSVIFDEIVMMSMFAGVFISITIFCILCVIYKKGKTLDLVGVFASELYN